MGKHAARKLSALLLTAFLVVSIAGCGTDRSNLLSSETAGGLEAEIDRIEGLVAARDCFEALDRAEAARLEVEGLRGEIDERLRTTLLDGLTQLQVVIQDECDPEATDEVVVEEETTDTGSGGVAPESDRQGNGGGGGQDGGQTRPQPEPDPQPTPAPTPTPTPPDSGGVSPGGTAPVTGGGSG